MSSSRPYKPISPTTMPPLVARKRIRTDSVGYDGDQLPTMTPAEYHLASVRQALHAFEKVTNDWLAACLLDPQLLDTVEDSLHSQSSSTPVRDALLDVVGVLSRPTRSTLFPPMPCTSREQSFHQASDHSWVSPSPPLGNGQNSLLGDSNLQRLAKAGPSAIPNISQLHYQSAPPSLSLPPFDSPPPEVAPPLLYRPRSITLPPTPPSAIVLSAYGTSSSHAPLPSVIAPFSTSHGSLCQGNTPDNALLDTSTSWSAIQLPSLIHGTPSLSSSSSVSPPSSSLPPLPSPLRPPTSMLPSPIPPLNDRSEPVRNSKAVYALHSKGLQTRFPNDALEKCIQIVNLASSRPHYDPQTGEVGSILTFVVGDPFSPKNETFLVLSDSKGMIVLDSKGKEPNPDLLIFEFAPGEYIPTPGHSFGSSLWWRNQECGGCHPSTGGKVWTARTDSKHQRRRARILNHFATCEIGETGPGLKAFAESLQTVTDTNRRGDSE